MPPNRLTTNPRRTNAFVWCVATICTIISIAVIILGVTVVVGYIVIHPRVPIISVVGAYLNDFLYDGVGHLQVHMIIRIKAQNDNQKAHASFSSSRFTLKFDERKIAYLENRAFDVQKNFSVDFDYPVTSSVIPLNAEQMELVDTSLRDDRVSFELEGSVGARWKVGPLGSFKFDLNLNCVLNFNEIPIRFLTTRGEHLSLKDVSLVMENGDEWSIKLLNESSKVWLHHGFAKFLEFYSIKQGQ
ncbi:uncharacterized protein [Rutidosis leptorrhynchoides]|uniref:uncharacterized protein n=1 Tax=Rutidosis leptorrhynchoides TaxID=125765 RepID=UPI003A994CC9